MHNNAINANNAIKTATASSTTGSSINTAALTINTNTDTDPMTGPVGMSPAQLDTLERLIDGWLSAAVQENPSVAAIERGRAGERRWYLRVHGQEKQVWTIWFSLGQRTLQYETYLMPPPQENTANFYEHLLRRNRQLTGLKLEIGPEDAIFLSGATPVALLTAGVLDGILGAMYAATELIFAPAMRIGYTSVFEK